MPPNETEQTAPQVPGHVASTDQLGAGAEARTTLERFRECGGNEEPDPVERLRFFCSLAMSGQDWLDVEAFFDDVLAERASA